MYKGCINNSYIFDYTNIMKGAFYMKNKAVQTYNLTGLRTKLAINRDIDMDYYERNSLPLFLNIMQLAGKDVNMHKRNNEVCDCIIDGKIIVRFYIHEREKKALSELDVVIDSEGYEWGILLHRKGIWLLNRDIYRGDEAFTNDRIVFAMSFTCNKDHNYLKYLSYDNLIGTTRNAKYFADITDYKNRNFNSTNKASWAAYGSALKRFFNYYAENKHDYSHMKYTDITFSDFEEYVKESTNINSETSAKNQLSYIKGFMISKTGHEGKFARGRDELLVCCWDILRKKNDEFVDITTDQVQELIYELSHDRNGTRNITLLLMLMGMGIERRRVCTLRWDYEITKDMTHIQLDCGLVIIPRILERYLKELRMEEPKDAVYVFGNCKTNYVVPLREESINGMLTRINNTIKNHKGINMITPAGLRRWLFLYLLDMQFSLQEIMCMMNISVANLRSYIDDVKLKDRGKLLISSWDRHPMDEFFEGVKG